MAISVGSAVGAGFNLIGRRPLAVLGWGAFMLLVILVIEVLAFALFGFPTPAASVVGAGLTPTAILQQMGSDIGRTLFVTAVEMPLFAVMAGAVMRAVLEPDHRGFASIRVGGQEGALLLLYLLLIPVWIGVCVVSIAPVGLSIFLATKIGGFLGGFVAFLLIVGYLMTLMWFSLRFSMAIPMTFVERRVRFLGSWEVTRGEGWRLFGLAWLLLLVGVGIGIAFLIAFFILVMILAGVGIAVGAASGLNAQSISRNPGSLLALGPVFLLVLLALMIPYSFFIGCTQAIFQAPWAEAYREIKGSGDVSATFT
ncbi:MAG: hypothetical protein ACHP7N_17670 [Caulobacterales bacterium]